MDKDDATVAEEEEELELTPTPKRRQSMSINSSKSAKLTFPLYNTSTPIPNATYDSGNYSSDSNISDTSGAAGVDPDLSTALLKAKDQDLFFTLQDVGRLQSEMQRLHVSEQWYKEELRQQSSTRLDVLERLYAQERKYMKENQKLQRECMRLYAKCSELENELAERREQALDRLSRNNGKECEAEEALAAASTFEIEQQRALIKDQQELIAVLRKQKRALLEDLERLGVEKDDRVGELQHMLSDMELQHKRATGECEKLSKIRRELEDTLEERTTNWEMDTSERQQLEIAISELREQLATKAEMLAAKEREISACEGNFKAQLENTTSVDEVHLLSLSYHAEISAKTAEIKGLKAALHALQEELAEQQESASLVSEQERMIEDLNCRLAARQLQMENLEHINASKTLKIAELELNIEDYQKARERACKELQATKTKLKRVEQELIGLHAQYASMCALCERTKLELELQTIQQGKQVFEAATDARDTEKMRARLGQYLATTAEMSSRISMLENELQESRAKKAEMQQRLADATSMLEEEKERCVALNEAMRANVTEMAECRADVALKCRFWESELAAQAHKHQQEMGELRRTLRLSEDNIKCLKDENARLQVESDEEEEVVVAAAPPANFTEEQFNNKLTVQRLDRELKEQQAFTAELSKENQRLKLHIQERDEMPGFGETSTLTVESLTEESADGELEKLSAQNAQLLDNLNKQRELFAEKTRLLERFKTIISNEAEMQQQLIKSNLINKTQNDKPLNTDAKLLQTAAMMESLIQQNQALYRKYKSTDNFKLRRELREKTEQCARLQYELGREIRANNIDHENYALQPPTAPEPRLDFEEDEYEELLRNKDILEVELSRARRTIDRLHKDLRIRCEVDGNIDILMKKPKAKKEKIPKDIKPEPTDLATIRQQESDAGELLSLRTRVQALEEQLEVAIRAEDKLFENKTKENGTMEQPKSKQEQTQKDVKAITELTMNRVEISAELETPLPPGELFSLKAKVRELKEQLEISNRAEGEKRAERIELINKLLAQQNDKVQQLQAAQVEWEELLEALNAAQRLEEQTREELHVKSAELEELNKLFEQQNEELRDLHGKHLVVQEKLAGETEQLRETFQQQAETLREQLKVKCDESAEQELRIAEFKLRNESYKHDLNDLREQNASEIAAQQRQLRTLKRQLENLQQERETEAVERKALENELSSLRQSKRAAILMPELVLFSGDETQSETDSDETTAPTLTTPESFEGSRQAFLGNEDARLRILTKVLEGEYERKMQRYDLHIHTLLGNVKSLKKALKAAEQKTTQLRGEQARTADELQELQMAKRHAEELRFKCEQSQSTIKALEQALEEERQRFAATDEGKEVHSEAVGTHEVSNLIDDYKKLIRQSAAATQRPHTGAVLELIQRSNQCAPNLQQLESNISELNSDLQAFIAAYAQNVGGRTLTQDALKAQPSLLDELRVASENI